MIDGPRRDCGRFELSHADSDKNNVYYTACMLLCL